MFAVRSFGFVRKSPLILKIVWMETICIMNKAGPNVKSKYPNVLYVITSFHNFISTLSIFIVMIYNRTLILPRK